MKTKQDALTALVAGLMDVDDSAMWRQACASSLEEAASLDDLAFMRLIQQGEDRLLEFNTVDRRLFEAFDAVPPEIEPDEQTLRQIGLDLVRLPQPTRSNILKTLAHAYRNSPI